MREEENEAGTGSYILEYTLGDKKEEIPVPAIYFSDEEEVAEYAKLQFDLGQLVIAFRCGKLGVCRIQVNPVLAVSDMVLHGAPLGQIKSTTVRYESKYYQTFKYLQPGDSGHPSFLEINATTTSEIAFHAKVSHKLSGF